MYLELLIVLVLIVCNGILALSELALVSARKSRLRYLAARGNRGARTALHLVDDPGRFLSAVQIGITLIGIVAGAYGGATVGMRVGAWLEELPFLSPYGYSVGMGLTVVTITYVSLIVGELVPKRIALSRPEQVASFIARPMQFLALLATPAVQVLNVTTELVLRGLGLTGKRETAVTEDEVRSLISEGTIAGVFMPQEKEMIEGVLRLADRPVRIIMTPRSRVVWIDVEATQTDIFRLVTAHRYSRLLVCQGTVDRPVGVVHTKDLLPEVMRGTGIALAGLMTHFAAVLESTTILTLLNRFKKEQVHVAVVVDEYGTTEGLVTLTDVIEAVTGDLPELGEDTGPRIVRRQDGSWLVDGSAPTDEVTEATGVPLGESVNTLAGFVLEQLGRIPETGTRFAYGAARFEIVDMDGNRIDKVLIEITGTGNRGE